MLSPEQKAELLALLPNPADAASDGRPNVLGNDVFRTDVAKFQEDLSYGHLAKTWQDKASTAVVERIEGRYDAWKAAEAERWWGQA